MKNTMPRSAWVLATSSSVIGTVLNFSWIMLFIMQPWRSCLDDDVPAGCSALPRDVALLVVRMVAYGRRSGERMQRSQ